MFTPVFENDEQLSKNTTTNKPAKRGKSILFTELQEMDPSDVWYQVDETAHPDAKKFRTHVYRASKDGAGTFKIRTTNEGLFIKKTARDYTPTPRKPAKKQDAAGATPEAPQAAE